MQSRLLNEVKNKHSVNSERRKPTDSNMIPDEINLQTCLNCPLPKCKPRCGLLKRNTK